MTKEKELKIIDLYVNKKIGANKIGDKLNIEHSMVYTVLKRNKIERRNTSEAGILTNSNKNLNFRGDLRRKILKMYYGMTQRVLNNRGIYPTYEGLPLLSKDEFIELANENKDLLEKLYKDYLENNKQMSFSPSVDRIVEEKGYIKENIQFMPMKDNVIKLRNLPIQKEKIKKLGRKTGKRVKLVKDETYLFFRSARRASLKIGVAASEVAHSIKDNYKVKGWKATYI